MMKKVELLFFLSVLLVACDPFEYHPYDVRLDSKYKDINRKNIERIRAKDKENDTVRFAFAGDTQRWYDETEDFVKAVNSRNDIEFVIQGGDLSDFGMKKEFCMMHDILSKLKVPYVAIVGNHDHLGSGEEIYRAMYGDLNFAFVYGGVKFLGMNTNALEYDYSTPVPDFHFLEKELRDSVSVRYDRTVAMMHTPPDDFIFNNITFRYEDGKENVVEDEIEEGYLLNNFELLKFIRKINYLFLGSICNILCTFVLR